ncbi:phage tail tube protein [Salinilacihabitans rarus]|uniref:phage tail tube protein n=1 Tax=Salinilacihabitans rarus TaxID=2961596 RepID=UPI0020C9375D|nr:phage tail tube protein [Salinilacihabitans rarus]
MTSAGTTSVAWTREDSFLTAPSTPTYVYPGRNVSVEDVSLQNALQRSRLPDDNEAVEAIAQTLEGALSVQYDLVHPWALTDVFGQDGVDDGTGVLEWAMGAGQMATSRWYLGVDIAGSVAERELQGAATTQFQIQVSQGQPVRVTQTLVYADEALNTALTPGSIVGGDESPYVFHGGDLQVDATTQKKMQQGTLEIANGAGLDRGWDRTAVDAQLGDAEYTLNASKIATAETPTNVALAYGSTGATAPQDSIDAVTGSLDLTRGDGDSITFPLTGVRPNSYGWDNIPPSGDERVQEAIEMYVDVVEAAADVSMADPFA